MAFREVRKKKLISDLDQKLRKILERGVECVLLLLARKPTNKIALLIHFMGGIYGRTFILVPRIRHVFLFVNVFPSNSQRAFKPIF